MNEPRHAAWLAYASTLPSLSANELESAEVDFCKGWDAAKGTQ